MIRNHPHWNEDAWDSVSKWAQPPEDELDRVDTQLTPADESGERPDYSSIKLTLDSGEENLSGLARSLEEAKGRIDTAEIDIDNQGTEQERIKGEVIPAAKEEAVGESKDYTDQEISKIPDWQEDIEKSLKDAADAVTAAREASDNTAESQELLRQANLKVAEAGEKVSQVTAESERQAALVNKAKTQVESAQAEVVKAQAAVNDAREEVAAAGDEVESMSLKVQAAEAAAATAQQSVTQANTAVSEAGTKLEEMTGVKETLDQEWGLVMVEWTKTQEAWNLEQTEFNDAIIEWQNTQSAWNTAQTEWNDTQEKWNTAQTDWNNTQIEWNKAQTDFNDAMTEWVNTQTEWNNTIDEWRIQQEEFDNLQLEFNENMTKTANANTLAAEANRQSTEALSNAVSALSRDITRIYVSNPGNYDGYMQTSSGGTLVAEPGWIGRIFYLVETKHEESRADNTWYRTSMKSEPVPKPDGGRTYGSRDVVWYMVKPGVPQIDKIRHSELQTMSSSWTTVASWTAPYDTTGSLYYSFQWANMTLGGTYRTRLLVNGSTVPINGSMGGAPLFGHAASNGIYEVSERAFASGDRVEMQLSVDHSNPINRQVRNVYLRATYVSTPSQDSNTEA